MGWALASTPTPPLPTPPPSSSLSTTTRNQRGEWCLCNVVGLGFFLLLSLLSILLSFWNWLMKNCQCWSSILMIDDWRYFVVCLRICAACGATQANCSNGTLNYSMNSLVGSHTCITSQTPTKNPPLQNPAHWKANLYIRLTQCNLVYLIGTSRISRHKFRICACSMS